MKHNLHAIREGTMKVVFLLTACISILAVALICIFLFANGIPTMHKIGLGKFLFGMTWAPNQNLYGIFPMIIASILVTGGAILIGVPLGLLCALYLARFCPKRLYSVLKPAVDLLAGIPSIVYGFFGLVVLVPALQAMFGSGKSIVTASIMLGIMILRPSSASRNRRCAPCRRAITRARSRWAQRMSAACSPPCSPPRAPASSLASSSASAAPSARPWPS